MIEFLSGQISTIATGASLELFDGSFVEDSTALGSNSALTGLSNVSGTLKMGSGSSSGSASLSTTGALTNSGLISLGTSGRGTLSVAGALTNTGKLDIGSASVTANSFVNSATVNLSGALNVSGATTNNGSISIASDTEALAGAVGGAGSFSLSNANLQFDASVSAGQTISESGADALTLEQAQKFAATISGFGTGDTIDATNFVETGTTYNFVENSAMTGGTLTLTDTFEPDRQHPDDRPLFQLEFHPRPRQRDRHAGEVRLSGQSCGHGLATKARETRHEHIDMDGPSMRIGRRGQLEPGWRSGRKLGCRDSRRGAGRGRCGLDRDVNSITDSSDAPSSWRERIRLRPSSTTPISVYQLFGY